MDGEFLLDKKTVFDRNYLTRKHRGNRSCDSKWAPSAGGEAGRNSDRSFPQGPSPLCRRYQRAWPFRDAWVVAPEQGRCPQKASAGMKSEVARVQVDKTALPLTPFRVSEINGQPRILGAEDRPDPRLHLAPL